MLLQNIGLVCLNIFPHIPSCYLPFLGPGLREERPLLSNKKASWTGRKVTKLEARH